MTHSVETTVFKYFEFQSNTITIIPATATESLCPGKLCDAQSRLKIWGCATAGSKRIWALTINFTCEEFAPFEGLKYGTMTSHATTVRNFQIDSFVTFKILLIVSKHIVTCFKSSISLTIAIIFIILQFQHMNDSNK